MFSGMKKLGNTGATELRWQGILVTGAGQETFLRVMLFNRKILHIFK
jgi:hypothetical protein